jgi:hypothetical protein
VSGPKLTPWFSASVDPVRPGLYRVDRPTVNPRYPRRTMLRWNGVHWMHTEQSTGQNAGSWVHTYADMRAAHGDKWRGLASDPKEFA